MLNRLVIIFMILYYIRPHEWVPVVGMVRPVAITLAIGILGLMAKGLPMNCRDLFKTPHDWFMMAFFGYAIYYAPDSGDALSDLKNRIVMYLILVHGLTTIKQLTTFCWWWCGLIASVAFLAWLSYFGIDPTNAAWKTAAMDGRLLLGTSIFNNPNALGHAVIPLLPMLYQLAWWRRPFATKQTGIAILCIPLHVLALTQSKGSYLAGAVAAASGVILGRSKWVQLLMVVLAITLGTSALQALPRMGILSGGVEGLKNRDEGIYGRWQAMAFGLDCFEIYDHGVGYNKWMEAIERADIKIDGIRFVKPAHCSYAEVGGELGPQGLFIWLGCLYCCLRTLLTCKCRTVEEERIRRILFAVTAAYMASCWFTNISYRGTFFLTVGATAAFHRVLQSRDELELSLPENRLDLEELPQDILVESPMNEDVPPITDRGQPYPPFQDVMVGAPIAPLAMAGVNVSEPHIQSHRNNPQSDTDPEQVELAGQPLRQWLRQRWSRLGIIDFALAYGLYYMVRESWIWLVENL